MSGNVNPISRMPLSQRLFALTRRWYLAQYKPSSFENPDRRFYHYSAKVDEGFRDSISSQIGTVLFEIEQKLQWNQLSQANRDLVAAIIATKIQCEAPAAELGQGDVDFRMIGYREDLLA